MTRMTQATPTAPLARDVHDRVGASDRGGRCRAIVSDSDAAKEWHGLGRAAGSLGGSQDTSGVACMSLEDAWNGPPAWENETRDSNP